MNSAKTQQNENDFIKFFRLLNDEPGLVVNDGKLFEVDSIPGGKYIPNDMPLLVGKISTDTHNSIR